MNNILYITYVDYFENNFQGVKTKIQSQIATLQQEGYKVDRINQYGKVAQLINVDTGEARNFKSFITKRFSIYEAVKVALSSQDYSAAYIRFQFFSEDVRKLVKILKSHGVRVLMEFPTFPYDGEIQQQGTKGQLKLICDKLYRKACAENIDLFVTLNDDKIIYGVPTVKVINGLDYSEHPIRQIRQPNNEELHLIAVASMLPWHGYDRLLLGMANYYGDYGNKPTVYFHIVGNGKEVTKYEKIVKEYELDNYVIFHGMKDGDQLKKIVSGSDIAVGSLAAFRIGLNRLSTLKSREYCAWGLPTINCTSTDILDREDRYCLFIPEDESPVNIESVISFYNSVYFEGKTVELIAREIREKAKLQSDSRIVFQPVIDFINKV